MVLWIGQMIPRAGVTPGRPHRVLKSHFNVEQTRKIKHSKEQEEEHGRDERKFQHGSPCSRRAPAPPGSYGIGAQPLRRSLSFGPTSAHYCRGQLLLLTSHTG